MFNVRRKEKLLRPIFSLIFCLSSLSEEKKSQVLAERTFDRIFFFHRFFQRKRNDDSDEDDYDDEDLKIIGMEGFIPLRTLQPGKRSTKQSIPKTGAAKDRFFSLNNCEQVTSRGDFSESINVQHIRVVLMQRVRTIVICRFVVFSIVVRIHFIYTYIKSIRKRGNSGFSEFFLF